MVKLFKHQQESLDQTKGMNRVAYYLDMGLGKTFVGSEKMMEVGNRINLVVCQKSKVDDWVNHILEHYEIVPYNLTIKSHFNCFMADMNTDATLSEEELSYYDRNHPIFAVINYDILFRRKWLKSLQNFTLMLDESSLIQNENAKRTKFILSMNPSSVILLSGTPTSGKYENLWTQLHLLGWNISQNVYNRQYVNWKNIEVGGFIHKIVDKTDPYKNVDRLKSKLREHGAVFLKTEECFELPEQTFIPVMVDATKEYRKFKKDSIVQVHTGIFDHQCDSEWDGKVYDDLHELVGDTTLSKMLYLRMLCGQYNKEKLEAFKDLVESTNDRLIVFYNFNEELERLKKVAQSLERPVSEVNGHVKDLTAFENEDDSITFVQYQSGAMGLNLQKANKIIYFTPTLSCENWMQSQKRIHRIGQPRPCYYYTLICRNSIEEQIYESLKRGVDFTNELFEQEI